MILAISFYGCRYRSQYCWICCALRATGSSRRNDGRLWRKPKNKTRHEACDKNEQSQEHEHGAHAKYDEFKTKFYHGKLLLRTSMSLCTTREHESVDITISCSASNPRLTYFAPKPIMPVRALVAQLDRASGYEPEGRGFDSLPARHMNWLSCVTAESHFRLRRDG